MVKLVNSLLRYLRPNFTAYHLRATHLIWALERTTKHSHVEAILAQSMTSDTHSLTASFEAFGVLWRLTGTIHTK